MASIATGTLGATWLVGAIIAKNGIGAITVQQKRSEQQIILMRATIKLTIVVMLVILTQMATIKVACKANNEAYRSFNCLQGFNEWECEGWDSDDEEEYVQQAEERAHELRCCRTHHRTQSETRRRQQAIDNIWRINSQDDLQAILQAFQYRAQNLGLQIRDN